MPDEIVRDVPYRPLSEALPVEAFTLSSLHQRRGTDELSARQRPQFEILVWCTAGAGRHEVDFEEVELVPGRILHIRSGQVHRWMLDPAYDAQLILLRELGPRVDSGPGPRVVDADRQLEVDLQHVIGLIAAEGRTESLSIRSLEVVRDLVVSRLGLDQRSGREQSAAEVLFGDFVELLGDTELLPRTVHDCASTLGCSTRTLARVCAAKVGRSPKAMVDEAVALEAQRRLSIGEPSIAYVAESLGFVELSNFTRFFRRTTGRTPSSFVASLAA